MPTGDEHEDKLSISSSVPPIIVGPSSTKDAMISALQNPA